MDNRGFLKLLFLAVLLLNRGNTTPLEVRSSDTHPEINRPPGRTKDQTVA